MPNFAREHGSIARELYEPQQGVYKGPIAQSLGLMMLDRVGVGVYPSSELEMIAATVVMGARRQHFFPEKEPTPIEFDGKWHRNEDDDSIIVHRMHSGSGKAFFVWPVQDREGYDPSFNYSGSRDVIELGTPDINLNKDTIVVAPSNSWAKFVSGPDGSPEASSRLYLPAYPRLIQAF